MGVKIHFSDLWTYKVSKPGKRLPQFSLPASGEGHIHGKLQISINGRNLPRLGYSGPEDVCFNQWFPELHYAVRKLQTNELSVYVYDEGEQGQPAYKFRRRMDKLYVSVIASEISDGPGDESWQDVECDFGVFVGEVASFEIAFRQELKVLIPHIAEKWVGIVLSR